MQDIVAPLAKSNTTLVAVTPEISAQTLPIIETHKLGFDVLSDPGNDYAAKLGLRFALPPELKSIYSGFGLDFKAWNGDDSWTLPMPARIVVDASGIVRATNVDPDYTRRPEPQKTVDDVAAMVRQ